MEIKLIDKKELSDIYNKYMIADFPQEELKSLELLLDFYDNSIYYPYGLYENNNLVAYAMMFKIKNSKYMLLDYFAVCKERRSKGYGSKFLELLQNELTELNVIIFEVESGKNANSEKELEICKKRIKFYLNNGLVEKKLTCILNKIDLTIFLLPISENSDENILYNELDTIYKVMYGDKIYGKEVFLKKLNKI